MKLHRLLAAALIALAPVSAFANSTTTNLGLNMPTVGADTDNWGSLLNTNSQTLDGLFGSGPVLLVTKGGTGANSASGARTNLGLGTAATQNTGTANGTVPLLATGTWTPTASFSTAGSSTFTYQSQTGRYSQIGDLEYIDCDFVFTPTNLTGASGTFVISGLPATVAGTNNDTGSFQLITGMSGVSGIVSTAANGSTQLRIIANGNVIGPSNFTLNQQVEIRFSMWYKHS